MPRRLRSARTSISVAYQMVANWRSEKPACLALRNSPSLAAESEPAWRSSSSISTNSLRFSRNQGSMSVSSKISSTVISYLKA